MLIGSSTRGEADLDEQKLAYASTTCGRECKSLNLSGLITLDKLPRIQY